MILIRADSNEHIGTGHVMRCLSIAESFKAHGYEVVFITADHSGDKLLGENQVICLESSWNDLETETQKLLSLIIAHDPDLLLLDSYYATDRYISRLYEKVPVAYIDDFNTTSLNLEYLINYNIYANTMDYSAYEGKETKLLLGPEFAPLRNEFKDLPTHRIKAVSDIMISAGGADPERITERIMESICSEYPDIRFHFIVGALNPRMDRIKSIAKENTIIHINERQMSNLMQYCDIAVSAAGTTLYELCAAGIPTITYTLADNQLTAADEFDKRGMMINVGDCRSNSRFINSLQEHLNELIDNDTRRKDLSQKMKRVVDGCGSDRIVGKLTE